MLSCPSLTLSLTFRIKTPSIVFLILSKITKYSPLCWEHIPLSSHHGDFSAECANKLWSADNPQVMRITERILNSITNNKRHYYQQEDSWWEGRNSGEGTEIKTFERRDGEERKDKGGGKGFSWTIEVYILKQYHQAHVQKPKSKCQ